MNRSGWMILWAVAAYGQTVSNIRFDHVGDSSARLSFDVSSSFNALRVRYGTANCSSGTGGTVQNNGTSPATFRLFGMTATLAGLAPSTSYFICPEVSANGGTTWSSGMSATLTTGARIQILPIPAAPVNRVYPPQGGATLDVLSDCSNLQAQMNAAAYGDTIVVPAGTICTGTYTLPDAPGVKTFPASAVRTSDSRITLTAHGFSEDQEVRLSSSGCLPGMRIFPNGLNCDKGGGWSKGAKYFVHVLDANNFQLMDAVDGNPVRPGFIEVTADATADRVALRPTLETPDGFRDTNGASISSNAPVQFHTTGTLPGGLSANTTYFLLSGCSPAANALCTSQVSTTSGGTPIDITSAGTGTLTIVDQGTGTHSIMSWPPPDQWIVVTTSGSLPPPGVRVTPDWDSQMFRIRQTQTEEAPYRLQTGRLAHNWRFVGVLFDTGANSDFLTTVDPRPYGRHVLTLQDSSNIVFERSRVQGPGFPNRFGTISMTLDGSNVGWIDSDLRGMDYWHTWNNGLGTARNTETVVTVSAGTGYAGIFTTTLSGTTTITITGGNASGTGYIYFAMDGTLKVLLPTGMTATCAASGATCTVSNAAAPTWPVNANGRVAALKIGTFTLSQGLVTSASSADGFSSANATEGSQSIIAGNGPGPYIFDNNIIEGTGIPLHFDDSGGPFLKRGDYNITRNTFRVPAEQMALGSASPHGLRYGHRQPLEWKGGNRLKVDGNVFVGNFEEDSPIGINIALTPRSGGYTSDVDITNNSFVETAGGINLCAPIDSFHPVSAPCARQRFSNNLFLMNGHTYKIPNVSSGDGWAFYGGYASEDILIDHNTIFDNRGANPALIHWILMPIGGMRITSNVYFYTGNSPALQNENVSNCPGSDKVLMDCAFTSGPGNASYTFARNLLVPSWSNTQTPSGFVGASTVQNAFPSLTNHIPNGNSVTANLNLIKFALANTSNTAAKLTGLDLRLAATSPYLSNASDGTQVGANMDQLQRAQGLITQLRAIALSGISATVSAFVPDPAEACYAGYGTSRNPASWTWTSADTTNNRQRNIVLNGLSSGTTYFYSLACRRTAMPSIETFRTP